MQSVTTFTNTIGSIPVRRIRVFGVQDALLLSTSPSVESAWGTSNAGAQDGFCVADTTGCAVQIKFSSWGITAGASEVLFAKNTEMGPTWQYHQSISINNGAWLPVGMQGKVSFEVPAGVTQTDINACTAPNVRKSIISRMGAIAPTDGIYSDVVTITATPV